MDREKKWKKIPCRFWLNGYCKFGDKCKNVHVNLDKKTDFTNKYTHVKPVIIIGKWADVNDEDPFY